MPRLRARRNGELLVTSGKLIPFSFWPAKKATRWALQRRLYVKDPWATLLEAVYRSNISRARINEALSYLGQAEEFFDAGTQAGGRLSVKPLLLYYSVLNLSKAFLAARNTTLDLSHAYHGLTATRTHKWAILGDEVKIKTSAGNVNVFAELMDLLEGHKPHFSSLEIRHILPQIVPGHRLWTYASGRKEQFIKADIVGYHDPASHEAWLNVVLDRSELSYLGKSVKQALSAARLPGKWEQVQEEGVDSVIFFEQRKAISYVGRPLDCANDLFRSIRPATWCVVTGTHPHTKYYINTDDSAGPHRLPQWASVYVLFYYLSDLTRYRPVHFDRFLDSRYGPQIESILDECPRQFLFLMASELLQREVAPADLA